MHCRWAGCVPTQDRPSASQGVGLVVGVQVLSELREVKGPVLIQAVLQGLRLQIVGPALHMQTASDGALQRQALCIVERLILVLEVLPAERELGQVQGLTSATLSRPEFTLLW